MTAGHAIGLRTLTNEYVDEPVSLEGSLPEWLTGTLVRNGPGKFETDDGPLQHWFDGLALIRRFGLDGSADTVRFSARFLRSAEYEHVRQTGSLKTGQFGTAHTDSYLEHLRNIVSGELTDNASIGIDHGRVRARSDGGTRVDRSSATGETEVSGTSGAKGGPQLQGPPRELVALTETPNGVAFDTESLDAAGAVTRDGGLDVTGVLGHPHETRDGDAILNMGMQLGPTGEYVLYRQPRSGSPERIGCHAASNPAYFHSFGLSRRYAVLYESPYRANTLSLLTPGAFSDAYEWDPEAASRFIVFDRSTGETVATPSVPPMFVFHHANAYEDGNELVVDLVAYEHSDTVESLYLENLRSADPVLAAGELTRFRIPIDNGPQDDEIVDSRTIHQGPVEFPTINYRAVNAREHRFVYAAGNREHPPTELTNRLLKIDAQSGDEIASWEEPGTYTGEPLFVPDPSGEAEDDGAIVTVVLNSTAEISELLVLDAADLSEHARGQLPTALPFGFHSQFYPVDRPPRRLVA